MTASPSSQGVTSSPSEAASTSAPSSGGSEGTSTAPPTPEGSSPTTEVTGSPTPFDVPPTACEFCPGGLVDPDLVLPGDGPTCAMAQEFASSLDPLDDACAAVKLAEEDCCPAAGTGSPTPAATAPSTATTSPTTASSVVDGTASPTLTGSPAAPSSSSAPGTSEPTSTASPTAAGSSDLGTSPPTVASGPASSDAPTPQFFYYNGFESGTWPDGYPEWTLGGDGDWELTTERANRGVYSIRSPNLDNDGLVPRTANVTISSGEGTPAGTLLFSVLNGGDMPFDIFTIYVDGEMRGAPPSGTEFEAQQIQLGPGPHEVTFSYEFNPEGLPALPPESPSRIGAVFIDDVYFLPEGVTLSPTAAVTLAPTAASLPQIPLEPTASPTVSSLPTEAVSIVPVSACHFILSVIVFSFHKLFSRCTFAFYTFLRSG